MGLLALVAAAVCFLVTALLGFAVFSGGHVLGWLGLGLFALAVAFLVGVGDARPWGRG